MTDKASAGEESRKQPQAIGLPVDVVPKVEEGHPVGEQSCPKHRAEELDVAAPMDLKAEHPLQESL